jgi:poly(3-hydroxybutyrate) depolymerase
VVLVFHGALTNASIAVRFTGLNEKADKEGFLAVYPKPDRRKFRQAIR